MTTSLERIGKIKSIEWICLSTVLLVLAFYVIMTKRYGYPRFRQILVFIIIIGTIVFFSSLYSLDLVLEFTKGTDFDKRTIWYRILIFFCEFSVWLSIYLVTFLVS